MASLKERLLEVLGGYSRLLVYWRRFRPLWLWRRTSPFGWPTTKFVEEYGLEIRYGPFTGVAYPKQAIGRANYLTAKLLGTYEPEIVDRLADWSLGADVFVDVGAGDGFFCAGLAAIAAPDGPHVIGFEMNRFERGLMKNIAGLNGLKVDCRGRATTEMLNQLPEGRLLILMDVEGHEQVLLDPVRVPRLTSANILVETHDQFVPGITDELADRFRGSHRVEWIEHHPPDPESRDELSNWNSEQARIATSDGHSKGQGWLFLEPTGR